MFLIGSRAPVVQRFNKKDEPKEPPGFNAGRSWICSYVCHSRGHTLLLQIALTTCPTGCLALHTTYSERNFFSPSSAAPFAIYSSPTNPSYPVRRIASNTFR